MFQKTIFLKLNRTADFLFYLIIFLVPFQKRFFLQDFFTCNETAFIDYSSFYVSFPELLILMLVFIKGRFILNNFIKLLSNHKNTVIFFLIILLTSFNILNSANIFLSFHKIFHFFIWILFAYLGINILSNSKKIFSTIAIIILSSLFQSLIAIYQFIFQKSLGLKFLGESILSTNILGVAKIDSSFGKIIRAYGTEPHPNVLGCFLLLGIIVSIFYLAYFSGKSAECSTWNILDLFFKRKKNKLKSAECSTWNILDLFFKRKKNKLLGIIFKKEKQIIILITLINILALVLTFSRTAIFLLIFFLVISFLLIKKNESFKRIILLLIGFTIFLNLIFLPLLKNRFNEEGSFKYKNVTLREIYSDFAFRSIKNNPIKGIGMGNFVFKMQENNTFNLKTWELQPVHNIYLLAISELGIILFSFIFFLFLNSILFENSGLNSKNKLILVGLFLILMTGLWDHYLYSFSQGISILTVIIIILISCKKHLQEKFN
jgi:O-antigen ligase